MLIDFKVGIALQPRRAHIDAQSILAREALIILHGVGQQHRISELGATGEFIGLENDIGDLSKTPLGNRIGPNDFDVSVKDLIEAFHILPLYLIWIGRAPLVITR